MKFRKRSNLVKAATVVGVGALASASVVAQEIASAADAAELEEVVVTGSRIKRQDLTSVGPVTVLNEADIRNTGITNLETLLQRLPAAAGFGGSANAAYWVSNGWGTPQINLRGLGINRTLVLINGRRVVFGGTGANSAVDLSLIPMSLISRVEVLKDGASATYGADAVAGVVNLITKDSFEGMELVGKLGSTDEGDGEEVLFDMTWGESGERGNIMVNLSYQENRAAPMWDESRAPCPGEPDGSGGNLCNFLSSATAGGRGVPLFDTVLPNGDFLAAGTRVNFNNTLGGDGDLYELYNGAVHGFNYNEYFNSANPIERFSMTTLANHELTENVNFFTELMYTKRRSNQPASPATLRNVFLPASHPTNPTGVDFNVQLRRLVENGARHFEQETDTLRVVAGLDGTLDGWNWELAMNWGRNTGSDAILNNINMLRMNETLDASACGMNGIPCADIVGVGVGQDVLDYVVFNQVGTGGNEQLGFSANVSGELFELPAGTVGVAFGAEVRNEKGWRVPDSMVTAGFALGNQEDPISGKTRASEIYSELNVPLLADLPMVQNLDMDVALRYSDYDLFGGDTNYKVGFNWRINDMVKLRGTTATAFRIPNVPELFGGVAEGNLTTVDPCSGWDQPGVDSTVAANCQADGVPAGFTQLGNTILTDRGGNPNLKPETAESFTAGAVIEPIDGLSITVDYFDIEISNAIAATGGSTKLAFCYNSQNLSHPFCGPQHFTRDSLTGEINYLSTQNANTGSAWMKGIDYGIVYNFDAAGLLHTVDVKATYLQEYETTAFEGDAPFAFDGFIGSGNGGYPHWRANASWTTSAEKWNATWSVQMIGKGDDFNFADDPLGGHMATQLYHNVQFGYRLTDAAQLTVGVDNLFQNDPPYVASWTDANTDTMTYDLLGRRGYIRFSYKFD